MRRERQISMGLCVILCAGLLAGCGGKSAGVETEAAKGTTAVETTAEVTESVETEVPAETETAGAETAKKPTVVITDVGGIKVKVDYSGYKPAESTKTMYTRLTEEWIPDLVAGYDYGQIYPFVGTPMYSKTDSGYSGVSFNYYGMIDASGRIIADPTYIGISPASRQDYYTGKIIESPYWILSRVDIPEFENEEDYWGSGTWRYTVASLDGSLVMGEYGTYRVMECGIYLADSYEAQDFIILGNDGKIRMDSRKLPFRDRFTEYSAGSVDYGDGFLSIDLRDGTYYMDLDGNLVLGPYAHGSAFVEGHAIVNDSQWMQSGLIDTKGNYVLPMGNYNTLTNFRPNGYCLYSDSGDEFNGYDYKLIDAEGRLIQEWNAYSMSMEDTALVVYDYGTQTQAIFDWEGQPLAEIDMEKGSLLSGTSVVSEMTEDGCVLRNLSNGKEREFKGQGIYAYCIPVHTDGVFDGDMDLDSRYILVNEEKGQIHHSDYEEVIWSCSIIDPETLETVVDGYDYANLSRDSMGGTVYINGIKANGQVDQYDSEGNKLGTYSQTPVHYKDKMMVVDDTFCTYQNADGKVFFRYRLNGGYAD